MTQEEGFTGYDYKGKVNQVMDGCSHSDYLSYNESIGFTELKDRNCVGYNHMRISQKLGKYIPTDLGDG